MLQLIKKAAIEAVEANKPCEIVMGTVVGLDPISVKIDQKLILAKEFISLTYTAAQSLALNDCVAMIRSQGGQNYLILDKVV